MYQYFSKSFNLRHNNYVFNIFVATLTLLRLMTACSISTLRTRSALVARDKFNWKILMNSRFHSGWLYSLVTALCRCGLRINIIFLTTTLFEVLLFVSENAE